MCAENRTDFPAVTAVVPCFNAAPWIRQCLESILDQSHPVEEIIVVDDGSTDSSADIVAEYPVTLIRLDENRGASAARNAGLDAASHPLVAWLDADDQWDPDHCATLVPLMARYPEAAVAFSRVRFAERPRRIPWGIATECSAPVSLFEDCLQRCAVPIMASITRRDVIRAVGGFREDLEAAVDFDLFLRLSLQHRFVWSTKVTATYRWRLSANQISSDERQQLCCQWRSRLLLWRELGRTGETSFAAATLARLRELWAGDLASSWRRRDVAAVRSLLELPDSGVLDGVLSSRLRTLLDRPDVAPDTMHGNPSVHSATKRGSKMVTIAIATRDRSALLRRALGRLTELDVADLEYEVVVVDNGSRDATFDVLQEVRDRLPLRVFREEVLGLSHARNRAVREARGTLAVWTDDDALVDREWLLAYARAAEQWPAASFFGGPIQPSFESEPPEWLIAAWSRLKGVYATLDLGDAPLALDRRHVPYGANFAVRTEVLRSHPFDTERGLFGGLRIGGEETSLFRRLLREGHSGRWVPEARVTHLIPEERLTLASVRRYFSGIGRTQALIHGPDFPAAWFEAVEAERDYRRARATSSPEVWVPKLIEASMARGRCWRGPSQRR